MQTARGLATLQNVFKVPLLRRKLSAAARDLGHTDARIRLEALRDLRAPGADGERDERVTVLLPALADAVPEVKKEALLALADLEAREALPAIFHLLSDGDLGVRSMATLALGEIASPGDEEALARVRPLLAARDPALRYQALAAHVRLAPSEAERALTDALGDEDAELRSLAVRLLEEHVLPQLEFPEKWARAITTATHDASADVRLVAELVAGQLGLTLGYSEIVAVVNRKRRVREPRDEQLAVELAGRLRLEAAKPGLSSRAFGTFGFAVDPFRWQARAGLAALGDARARALVEKALDRGSYQERTLAVFAIGQVDLESFRARLEALRDHAERVDLDVLEATFVQLDEK